MKITKSQLRQIIKEELNEVLTDIPITKVRRLYNNWQPETEEGQRYKDDLGNLIGTGGTKEDSR